MSGFAAVATIAAAAFAAFALYLSWQAVIETRRQANAADAALVAADRPWIEVIGLSVVWVEVSGLGVSANLAVRTKNTGRSPALRAFVDAEIVLDTQTNEVGNQAVAMCNRVVRDRDRFGVEGVVFPDGTRTMPLLRNIDPREIGRAWRRDLRREGRPFDPRAYDDGAKPKSASFAIVGCADYTFPSQRATGQTSFVYSLARNCGDAKLELPCDFDLAPARNYSGDEIISEANDFYGFAR